MRKPTKLLAFAIATLTAAAATSAQADLPSSEVDFAPVQTVDLNSAFIVLGDLNGDGSLTSSDIGPFVMALTNPSAYQTEYPGLDHNFLGDFSGDDKLTNSDIKPFLAALNGGEQILRQSQSSPVTVAPTPSALGAGLVACLALVARRRRSA